MEVSPSRAEALAHQGDETHLALAVELLADADTPISLYRKLRSGSASFLLESAEGGETFGRYSFIGVDPVKLVGADLDALERTIGAYRVKARPDLPRLQGGAVGWIAYDAVRHFEPTCGAPAGDQDGGFLIVEEIVIVDHLRHRVTFVALMDLAGDRAAAYDQTVARLAALIARLDRPLEASTHFYPRAPQPADADSSVTPEAYGDAVRTAKAAIEAGEIFQVVLSQRLTASGHVPSVELYRALRALNPSPYMFHLDLGDRAIVGASPEVLVRVEQREVLVRPIAGTRRRGRDAAEDAALEADLLADEKELAEHRMLLDLGRNDVGRIAETHSIRVERPMHVERYSHVMHIVSDVYGRLRSELSAFDAFRACFPAGTVSGAPKIRAMELIGQLEGGPRGVYAGAVGYFDFSGNMDTCIAIRTMVVHPDRIEVQAGAGIVYDSDPQREHEECMNKARGPLTAIAIAREIAGVDPDRR